MRYNLRFKPHSCNIKKELESKLRFCTSGKSTFYPSFTFHFWKIQLHRQPFPVSDRKLHVLKIRYQFGGNRYIYIYRFQKAICDVTLNNFIHMFVIYLHIIFIRTGLYLLVKNVDREMSFVPLMVGFNSFAKFFVNFPHPPIVRIAFWTTWHS